MSNIAKGTCRCSCTKDGHDTRLIAITGGPGAGKTAVLQMATRVFCQHIGVLSEAASIIFGGGFPRHGSLSGRRAAQRAIYHVQRQLEQIALEDNDVAVALCDRGTIDGVAYWPNHDRDYWSDVGSSLQAELQRYAAVIHLHTPTADGGYDQSNHLRTETPQQALALDQSIQQAWSSHPHVHHVDSSADFIAKASAALARIREHIPACCRDAQPAEGSEP